MIENQACRHYDIGREEYGAYWPALGQDGSYYVNVYYRHSSGSVGRETLVDGLTADQALALLSILEEAMQTKTKIEPKAAWCRCDRCRRRYNEERGDGYCGLCPNCADETEPHDMECGILTIDWNQRTFTVEGAGGHTSDVMRPHQVLKELRKKGKRGVEKVPFIVWQENADGYAQLFLHDRKSFKEEVRSM